MTPSLTSKGFTSERLTVAGSTRPREAPAGTVPTVPDGRTRSDRTRSDEERLITLLCQHADVYKVNGDRPDWAHRSVPDLLLKLGRLFTPAPRVEVDALPGPYCYAHAARTALAHDALRLTYAEGVALLADQHVYLAHA